MAQGFDRKNFLKLTITFTAFGTAAGCGDDDDLFNPDNPSKGGGGTGGVGTSGSGTEAGGKSAGGTEAGGASAGKTGGGTDTGGSPAAGAQGDGGTPGPGQAGDGNNAAGGGGEAGAANTGGAGGETSDPGQGGQSNAGQSGSGGEGGAGTCGGATFVQTAGPGHDHIPANPATMFASFTALVDGSTPTAAFALPVDNGHSHNIVLTAGQVALLRAGGQVLAKMSSLTNGHRHTYTISCA